MKTQVEGEEKAEIEPVLLSVYRRRHDSIPYIRMAY